LWFRDSFQVVDADLVERRGRGGPATLWDDFDATVEGEITVLSPDGAWPVLIERQLRYASQQELS
jgi:hypothetical protein